MIDTEDGVDSIATIESVDKDSPYDLPLEKIKGKSVPIDSDDEETITTSHISTTKDDRGVQETVTTTQVSTKKSHEGVAQSVTKVTKTQKISKKVIKAQRKVASEEEEEEENEEDTKSAVSITELSDDDKVAEPSTQKPTRNIQQITRVCFLFLFCHTIQICIH